MGRTGRAEREGESGSVSQQGIQQSLSPSSGPDSDSVTLGGVTYLFDRGIQGLHRPGAVLKKAEKGGTVDQPGGRTAGHRNGGF